jgi:hypothetical protein
MEPEKPAFAISVPSEDPEAKEKKQTDGDKPAENAAASSSKKATDGKAEPAADELVRPTEPARCRREPSPND